MHQMLQLRAWLVESEPEVWRQFVIDPRLTLEQLHTVMQIAFGWQNERILDLLENPKARRSEEQEELLEWPGDWDPDRFVSGEINQNLGRVRVKKSVRG